MVPWEHVNVLGVNYELHPPLAAIVCVPFVAFGIYDQTLISVLLGATSVALCFRLVEDCLDQRDQEETYHEYADQPERSEHQQNRAVDNHVNHAVWLTLFYGFGTVLFYEATLGACWGFCSIVSTIPTLLALIELRRRSRPAVVGFWATLACFARYDLVLTLPIYLIGSSHWFYPPRARRPTIPTLVAFAFWPLIGLNCYLLLNLVRFHTLIDPTLAMWYSQDIAGGKLYPWGPFSLHYLPLGIFTALFAGPRFSFEFPWLRPTAFGLSLLLTSPALVLVGRVRASRESWLLLGAALLSAGAYLTVWSSGTEQYSYRYVIQTLPFLLALMARTPIDRFAKTLIAASILLVGWGTMSIRLYGWG